MFERFTDTARHAVVQAQEDARRLGHGYIGCEHLLLAAAAAGEPASTVLRDHGVTPERIEAEIRRNTGRGQAADPTGGLDREALASLGIDLDVVRARIEAVFGPDALTRALPARQRRRPARGKGPLAELTRRRHRRRAAAAAPCLQARAATPRFFRARLPAAISRSRRAPRRPCSSRCARRRRCTTTTSASSTSPWPCSPCRTARSRRSCPPSAHRPHRCAPPSSPATARRADPRQPGRRHRGGRPGNHGGHNPTPGERPSTPRSSRPPLLPLSRRGLITRAPIGRTGRRGAHSDLLCRARLRKSQP